MASCSSWTIIYERDYPLCTPLFQATLLDQRSGAALLGNGSRLLLSTKPLALTNIAFGLLLNMIPCFTDAGVAEWVDAVDLKSAEPLARAGSTPALGIQPDNHEVIVLEVNS